MRVLAYQLESKSIMFCVMLYHIPLKTAPMIATYVERKRLVTIGREYKNIGHVL